MDDPRPATLAAIGLVALLAGCAGQAPMLEPRSIIIYSGERIQADPVRMGEVQDWLNPTIETIDLDPGFLVDLEGIGAATYPWTTLEITGDTVRLGLLPAAPDAETPFLVYAYLRLMADRGTLSDALPAAGASTGFDAERAILNQVADVWLLGRSVFDTQPFGPLDELVYASQFGHLDEFIFATQPTRFSEAEESFRTANPGSQDSFDRWFESTFESDGPQYVLDPDDIPPLDEPPDDQADG